MAYSNIGTPRFYCDIFSLYSALGLGGETTGYTPETYAGDSNVFNLNPSNQYLSEAVINQQHEFVYQFTTPMHNIHYVAILGHNLGIIGEDGGSFWQQFRDGTNPLEFGFQGTPNMEVNYPSIGKIEYHGFSIRTFTDGGGDTEADIDNIRFYSSLPNDRVLKIGCISMGSIYTMPHSPDLKLTMTREMDGVKRIRTRGGSDLIKHQYTKPPLWGSDAAPWELYTTTPAKQKLSRVGRRVWDLSFTQLQGSSVFPMLSSLTPYESVSDEGAVYSSSHIIEDDVVVPETDWHEGETLLDSDNFYSQVIHKTNGGQLPFIFQPDSSDNNMSGFAICKLDKEFKFEQVANGVYNVKLKIREVW